MADTPSTHQYHDHHGHSHGLMGHQASGNLALAFFLNLSFTVIELIGGLLTNSVAILSDALHDFGDSFSLGLAWYMQKVAGRHPNSNYTYGYRRYTLLSAVLNAVILLSGSIIVLVECVERLFEPAATNAQGMFLLAILGVLVNGFAVFRLKKGKTLNEKVVSLHLLEDVLGWLAVLVGSLIMMVTDANWLDPVLSILISIFILYNVVRNLRQAFRVLLQGKPDQVDEETIRKTLNDLPGVESIHDLHIWSMDSEYMVLSVHLVVNEATDRTAWQALRRQAHDVLTAHGIQHATIEMEFPGEDCHWCE